MQCNCIWFLASLPALVVLALLVGLRRALRACPDTSSGSVWEVYASMEASGWGAGTI